MKERIKQIRKEKKLSQAKFGELLGVSRDVISNYEMGRVEPTDLFIGYLCNTFDINELWLRTGEGNMFNDNSKTILDDLTAEYNLTNTEKALIETFLDLSPSGRKTVTEYIQTAATRMKNADNERDKLVNQQLSNLSQTIKATNPTSIVNMPIQKE